MGMNTRIEKAGDSTIKIVEETTTTRQVSLDMLMSNRTSLSASIQADTASLALLDEQIEAAKKLGVRPESEIFEEKAAQAEKETAIRVAAEEAERAKVLAEKHAAAEKARAEVT
jgi:ABC-type transporter Mla MlaB component